MQKILLSLFNVFLLINNYSNVLTCQKSTRKKIWDNTQESYINPTTQIYQPNSVYNFSKNDLQLYRSDPRYHFLKNTLHYFINKEIDTINIKKTKRLKNLLKIIVFSNNSKNLELFFEKPFKEQLYKQDIGLGLFMAIKNCNADMVDVWLKNNADLNVTMREGVAPIHFAAQQGNPEVVDLLLKYNADPNSRTNNGITPIHAAAYASHTAVIDLLLKKKVDPNLRTNDEWTFMKLLRWIFLATNDGLTPLHIAAHNGQIDAIYLLLKNNANLNLTTNDGWAPIHIAAHNGQRATVDLFLQNNVNPNLATNDGWTPLHSAAQNGHPAVVDLLLKHNADSDLTTNKGVAPIHIATQNRHTEVVVLFNFYNKKNMALLAKEATGDLEKKLQNNYRRFLLNFNKNELNKEFLDSILTEDIEKSSQALYNIFDFQFIPYLLHYLNNQDEIINPKIKKLFNTIVHQQNKSKQIVIENNKDDYKCFYCLEKQNNENDLIKLAIKNKNKVPAGIECYLCSGCLLSKPLITEKDPIDPSLPMITTLDNVDI